jgi:hypothetical protein
VTASIKVTLYSDEGPSPTIVINHVGPKDAARIEWRLLVGTAQHLLRNYREQLPEPHLAVLQRLVATQGEP